MTLEQEFENDAELDALIAKCRAQDQAETRDPIQETGIALIGQRLLQGWTMTDAVCEKSHCSMPLMYAKGVWECPTHGQVKLDETEMKVERKEEKLDPVVEVKRQQLEEQANIVANKNTDSYQASAKNSTTSSQLSALLGQRLLAGDTMLNEYCPWCEIVPLMRKKGNVEMLCVQCGKTFLQDADAVAMKPEWKHQIEKKENAKVDNINVDLTKVKRHEMLTPRVAQFLNQMEDTEMETDWEEIQPKKKTQSNDVSVKAALNKANAVLALKLHESSRLLEKCSEQESILKWLTVIRETALTMTAVQQVPFNQQE